jgi:hypothetical protein
MPVLMSIALIILAAFLSAVLAYYFARAQDEVDVVLARKRLRDLIRGRAGR